MTREVPGKTPQSRYGMLVRSDIEALKLIRLPDGVVDDPSCYRSASYDLRIGYECLLPSQDHSSDAIVHKLRDGDALIIPPYGARIVSTREHVSLPGNVAGKFNIRIRYALRGLIAQMGTQVEPEYNGPLFALLQNITDREVRIPTQGEENRIFTIDFYYLPEQVTPKPGETKTYSGIESVHDIVRFHGTLDGIIERIRGEARYTSDALNSLDRRIGNELKTNSDRRFTVYSIIMSVMVAAMLGVFGPFIINWSFRWPHNDPLFSEYAALVPRQIAAAKAEIAQYKAENEKLKFDFERRTAKLEEQQVADREATQSTQKKIASLEQQLAELQRVRSSGPSPNGGR